MNRYLLSHCDGEIGSKEVRDHQNQEPEPPKQRKWNSGHAKDQRKAIIVGAEENKPKE